MTLRPTASRDGFASVGSAEKKLGATLRTVPLIFHTKQTALFLNVKGGVRSLQIFPGAGDGAALLSMAATPGIPSGTDSTMQAVTLQAGSVPDLAALQGKPFRLSIELEAGARLYAFWVSAGPGGQSGGWLGAGGASYPHGLHDV